MTELKNIELTEEKIDDITRLAVRVCGDFDVKKVFDCGQCFRFEPVENSLHRCEYFGIAYGRAISVASDGENIIYIYNATREDFYDIWLDYLALDVDYDRVNRELMACCDTPAFLAAMDCGRGIRILNQEPYEALISFIISQNNNIPRIKQLIERLSSMCGERVYISDGMERHMSSRISPYAFPTAEALEELGISGLMEAKTGFRAKYIYDAVTKILSGELEPALPKDFDTTAEGVEYLCRVKGVGPKVASCALLFSCRRYDAFPVDVWIKRAMLRYFPDKEFSSDFFGEYAGIAQQYLFYYERYLGGEKQ